MTYTRDVLAALEQLPRWHVVHWGGPGTSTLLCVWVRGKENLVAVEGEETIHLGQRYPTDQLVEVLRAVQAKADAEALATPEARVAQANLLKRWSDSPRDGSMQLWEFPRGGSLRWSHDGETLHVEATEGGPYHQIMPEPLTSVLVDLGWNRPDGRFRNCWVQPPPGQWEAAAALGILTALAAFGYQAPPALDP